MSARPAWSGLFTDELDGVDETMARLLRAEESRQRTTVNLIASESYCPRAAIEAEASLLVNKNASGYPGRRDVGGCEVFDEIERLAIDRARALFGAEHANVQAMASTVANVAVLRALLRPGDRILALDGRAGGHHSHGGSRHLSGQDYEVTTFGIDETAGTIDLAEVGRLAREMRPRVVVAGSTACPRAIDFRGLHAIAAEVGAILFADIAHVAGLVVTGLHDNPAPYADVVTTSTHKTLCGPRTGGVVLSSRRLAEAIDAAIYPGIQGAPGPTSSPAVRCCSIWSRRLRSGSSCRRSWRTPWCWPAPWRRTGCRCTWAAPTRTWWSWTWGHRPGPLRGSPRRSRGTASSPTGCDCPRGTPGSGCGSGRWP